MWPVYGGSRTAGARRKRGFLRQNFPALLAAAKCLGGYGAHGNRSRKGLYYLRKFSRPQVLKYGAAAPGSRHRGMDDRGLREIKTERRKTTASGRHGRLLVLTAIVLLLCTTALAARLVAGAGADMLLIPAAALAILLMTIRIALYADAHHAADDARNVKFFKSLLNSTAPALLVLDDEGNVFFVNEAAERILGYAASELMGPWGTPELLPETEGQRILREIEKLCGRPVSETARRTERARAYLDCVRQLPASQVPTFQTDLQRKDGARVSVELHISVLREEDGAVRGLIAVATRQNASATAGDAPARFQDLVENDPALLATLSPAGRFLYANPAWQNVFGCDTPALKALERFTDLFAAAHRETAEALFQRALGGELVEAAALSVQTADGRTLELEATLSLRQRSGLPLAVRCRLTDVTTRNATNRAKDEFISTVSHELRTPLTSIRGALGLLSSGMLGPLNDKAANLLRIALNNSERLVRLINDILDLERMASGREPLDFHAVQLSEVIRQSIDGLAPVAEGAQVRLVADCPPLELTADHDRLLQVLTNLLSNAVKFSPENGTVTVRATANAAHVHISVIDQGRGIPADKLEAIFGRFQQVEVADARQKGGSGLGLAICRTIVLQHGGRIWAERNADCGSSFHVRLPLCQNCAEPVAPGEDGQGTVLLAGANAQTAPRITGLLTRHGYRVIKAANIDETLGIFQQGVQAVLLDTSLDGMNGFGILPRLRALDPAAQTPVVLLSVADTLTAAPESFAGWVAEPVEEASLVNELARVLCGPGEQARILVVEDDQDLAGILAQVFARESIRIEQAHSLTAALAACQSFRPHLLLLDVCLPDGDGFHLVDWLRQHPDFATLPLVVYSGRAFTGNERRQLTLGPTHFLAKTRVQPQQLEALVLSLLRTSRQGASTQNRERA